MLRSLVGSEMCIRDSTLHGNFALGPIGVDVPFIFLEKLRQSATVITTRSVELSANAQDVDIGKHITPVVQRNEGCIRKTGYNVIAIGVRSSQRLDGRLESFFEECLDVLFPFGVGVDLENQHFFPEKLLVFFAFLVEVGANPRLAVLMDRMNDDVVTLQRVSM